MHPEIAGDQNYDDHYANYSEDVHSVVLRLPDNSVRRASIPHRVAQFDREFRKYQPMLPSPAVSVIAAASEDQKNDNDNQN
jgi:hypothetical protein